jgi:phosphate transport system substrate-binding protein
MSPLRKIRAVLFIAVVIFASSAFASSISINGAGSTFIYPVFTKWADAYSKVAPNVRLDYQSVGSLQGVDRLLSHAIDFAASDAPLHLEQMNRPSCGTLYFPAVAGAVVVVYNLPQLPAPARVRLTGQVLGDIFLGKIKNWSDRAIVVLNPHAPMPNQPIIVNYRRDGSGTTFTFTDYLTKVNAQWTKQIGVGMSVTWPIGLPADGNEGLADAVKTQIGAIGYVELSYAIAKDLPYAVLQNRAGTWVEPSPSTIGAAAANLVETMPSDLQQSISDAPGTSAYPISSYSYLLFFREQSDPAKVEAFRKFVDWVLHDGQTYAAPLHYPPLPRELVDRVDLQFKQIALAKEPAAAIVSCRASQGLSKSGSAPAVRLDSDTAGPLFSD